MKKMAFLLCLFSQLMGEKVELFMYWQSWAKGEELFPKMEQVQIEALPMLPRLRRLLNEHGMGIKSWEMDQFRNSLMSWEAVKSIRDLWHWCFPAKIEGDSTWVFWSLGKTLGAWDLSRLPRKRSVLFLWEPPTVEPLGYDSTVQQYFRKIYTWDDDLVDGVKYFKFHYPELRENQVEPIPFQEKKLCTMVSTRLGSKHPKQLYSEREKVIRFFEDKPGEFDLYGRGWGKRKWVNWKGTVENKIETIKHYKFSIAYENMQDVRGYITEKIFDCFAVNNVPVYWGASNVTEYIPEGCFIDRRKFQNFEELYQFIKNMTEEEYNGYLDRIRVFVQSDAAKKFSVDSFIQLFLELNETHRGR